MRFARPLMLVGVVALALTTTACSGPAPAAGATKPTGTATVLTPPTHAAVPIELWGTWQPLEKVTGTGPLLLNLVFSAHSYAFYDTDITNAAIGRAWTAGADQVVLGARGPCDSLDTYTWKVTAGKLVLSGGESDQCQRHEPLVSRTWTKASDSTKPADSDVTQ